MSAVVPIYSYLLLKKSLGVADAAAIGATYGSNSTLTYITAAGFLTSIGVAYEGYMTVALVVMETPADHFRRCNGSNDVKKERGQDHLFCN